MKPTVKQPGDAQVALIQATGKSNAGMSLEQLNECLVKRSAVIREYVRTNRQGFYTSDIVPPLCYIDRPLHSNIDNVLACFSHTLAAALSNERRTLEMTKNFEALSSIIEGEKRLIFDFLSENGLTGKFNDFVFRQKIKAKD